MGEVYMVRGDYIGALDLIKRARDMYRCIFTFDDDHRDITKCWHLIREIQVALGNNTEASEAFEKILHMWTSKLPKYHPDIALCHRSMGEFYADKEKNINKAIEHLIIQLLRYFIILIILRGQHLYDMQRELLSFQKQ
jgi:tetratricopeptide (TPR) repeat protein